MMETAAVDASSMCLAHPAGSVSVASTLLKRGRFLHVPWWGGGEVQRVGRSFT